MQTPVDPVTALEAAKAVVVEAVVIGGTTPATDADASRS